MKNIKKIGRRGKMGLALLIAVMFIGVASAGLLTYYNTITVNANVEQSVLVDGKDVTEPINQDLDAIGGGTYYFKHDIENRAPIDATVIFDTTYIPELDENDIGTAITIHAMDPKTTLILENKDASWDIIEDETQATLIFDTMNPTFNYEFEATDLELTTAYCLIYYADFDERFGNWGGHNPGAFIAEFTTDGSGNIGKTTGSINLGMNLPTPPDWNIGPEADYTQSPDFYDHANGAKIWLVPSEYYDKEAKTIYPNWKPAEFLFETELIVYLDCDIAVEDSIAEIIIEQYAEDVTDGLTVEPGELIPLLFRYTFDIRLFGIYQITTNIVPVV